MQAKGTIKLYENLLKKYEDLNFLKPHTILESLQKKKLSSSYIKSILCAIVWHLRKQDNVKANVFSTYKYMIAHLRVQCDKKERDHNKTHGVIPKWEDIVKIRDELLKNGKFKDNLILSLYSYIPPRRIKDFILLKIAKTLNDTKDTNFNYYVLSKRIMIFNQFKTSKTYKQQNIKVPPELHNIIMKYIKLKNIGNGDLLLGMKNYLQMNYRLKKLIGAGVDNLRHSYINNAYSKFNIPSNDFIEKLSSDMGHSLETNLRYRKF